MTWRPVRSRWQLDFGSAFCKQIPHNTNYRGQPRQPRLPQATLNMITVNHTHTHTQFDPLGIFVEVSLVPVRPEHNMKINFICVHKTWMKNGTAPPTTDEAARSSHAHAGRKWPNCVRTHESWSWGNGWRENKNNQRMLVVLNTQWCFFSSSFFEACVLHIGSNPHKSTVFLVSL